jgi:Tfp pilus assembly protein PilP
MRLAKSSQTLLTLAFSAVLATCALAQDQPKVQPKAMQDQLAQQASGKPQAPAAPKAPAPPPAKQPARAAAKAPATPPAAAKTPAPAPAPAKAPEAAKESAKVEAAAPAAPPVEKSAEEKPVVRRDPFDTLLTKARVGNATPENLPPGKAGLVVETLNIDGIVHGPNGMIAIVSNSQKRVYFLREGDKLYDGSVEKIALDAISFHEIGKDAFGKPLERTVTKRLYPSSGEQQ